MRGRAREIVLGTLLLVLLIWAFRPGGTPEAMQNLQPDQEPIDWVGITRTILETVKISDALDPAGDYKGGGRNLFDYGVVKPPPPSPEELERRRKAAEERARREAEARAEAQRLRQEAEERQREAQRLAALRARQDTATPAPPAKPVPPPLTLKFIGVVGEPDHEIAILLDGTDFLLATEGETVKEAFRVEEIGYESLQMGYTDPQFEGEHKLMQLGG